RDRHSRRAGRGDGGRRRTRLGRAGRVARRAAATGPRPRRRRPQRAVPAARHGAADQRDAADRRRDVLPALLPDAGCRRGRARARRPWNHSPAPLFRLGRGVPECLGAEPVWRGDGGQTRRRARRHRGARCASRLDLGRRHRRVRGGVLPHRLPRWSQLVSKHRSQLGSLGSVRRRARDGAGPVRRGRSGPRRRLSGDGSAHREPVEVRARAPGHVDPPGLRSLDSAGATRRSDRRHPELREEALASRPGLRMQKNRLEAFSDGVIAIIITIMVLEMKVPHGTGLDDLKPILPVFLSYVLSFVYIGIYWSNHHHLLHATHRVSGGILWANLHLLFWLSLIPFVTGWMGENHFAALPAALYGLVLLLAGVAYLVLQRAIVARQGSDSILAGELGRDRKGKLTLVFYVVGIGLAFGSPWLAAGLYALVAAMWLVPDRRLERVLEKHGP